MNKFLVAINNYFTPLFWVFFIGAFVLADIQLNDGQNLKNNVSPKGIVSLELSFSYKKDTAIINTWQRDQNDFLKNTPAFDSVNCEDQNVEASSIIHNQKNIDKIRLAKHDIHVNFLFIFFYTALILLVIIYFQFTYPRNYKNFPQHSSFTKILLIASICAGACDVVENTGMLYLLNQVGKNASQNLAFITSVFAAIKFVILATLVFVYLPVQLYKYVHPLQQLSGFIKNKSRQLYKYRVIVIGIIIFSFAVWLSDQGQDLLINSNSSDPGVLILLTTITISAFLNWYLAKLFFNPISQKQNKILPFKAPRPLQENKVASEKKFSRFLGVSTIIIPAVAILNVIYVLKINSGMSFLHPAMWLILFLLIFFLIIKYDAVCFVYNKLNSRFNTKTMMWLVSIVLIILLFIIPVLFRIFAGHTLGTAYSLTYLFWTCMLIAMAFTVFVSLREMFPSLKNTWLGDYIGYPVVLSSAIPFLFFLLINFRPKLIIGFHVIYFSLPVVLSGIIFYTFFFTLLIRLSEKKKINLVLFTFIIAFCIASFIPNSYHEIKKSKAAVNKPKPDTLENYFYNWVMQRADEIQKADSTYPVFIINTYGGGIRAAAFTGMTFTYLDRLMMDSSASKLPFEHYVFSVSGASGGTIGAAIQCAYRLQNKNDKSKYSLTALDSFYRKDYLTPVLAGLLGSDIWGSIISPPFEALFKHNVWEDRSKTQEELWAKEARNYDGTNAGNDFDSYWSNTDFKYEIPLLFSNSLNVDDGLKGVYAPVILKDTDFPAVHFIRNEIDTSESVSLMTGSFLSARFPIISPSGKLGDALHYMDGGGKDNSGAGTSASIFLNIARNIHNKKHDKAFTTLCKKLKFYFISISNGSHTIEEQRQKIKNHFEPLSPITGIINSGISGNAHAADSSLKYIYAGNNFFDSIQTGYLQIWPTDEYVTCPTKKTMQPLLPLGWQISDSSLARLQKTFTNEDMKLTSATNDLQKLKTICKKL